MFRRFFFIAALALSSSAFAQYAIAQTAEAADLDTTENDNDTRGNGEERDAPAMSLEQEQRMVAEQNPSLYDEQRSYDDEKPFLFLGAAYQHSFFPSAFSSFALDKVPFFHTPGVALELGYHKRIFGLVTYLQYDNISIDGLVLSKDKPETDNEFYRTSLHFISLSLALSWTFAISNTLGLFVGFDVTAGGVFGSAHRNEAYPESPGNYAACSGPGAPDPTYCEVDGDYGREPNWSEGGTTPMAMVRVSLPHIGLRVRLADKILLRAGGGFSGIPFGFFFRVSLAYGL